MGITKKILTGAFVALSVGVNLASAAPAVFTGSLDTATGDITGTVMQNTPVILGTMAIVGASFWLFRQLKGLVKFR